MSIDITGYKSIKARLTHAKHPHPNFVSGGVDFEAAKSHGVKVIWALSLPGKVAPVTSGTIIKDTIMNIIKDLGV